MPFPCKYCGRSGRPWAELSFVVAGLGRRAEIFFRTPDSDELVSATRPGQRVRFELEPIALAMECAARKRSARAPDEIGRIVRNRHVLGNEWVVAGIRIPTIAIWEFHKAGYDLERIPREYSRLTADDVREAIAFEEGKRRSQADQVLGRDRFCRRMPAGGVVRDSRTRLIWQRRKNTARSSSPRIPIGAYW
jgi:uncharacterized protein (DUF433 family)